MCVCVTLNHDCPFFVLVHFSNAILCFVSTSGKVIYSKIQGTCYGVENGRVQCGEWTHISSTSCHPNYLIGQLRGL